VALVVDDVATDRHLLSSLTRDRGFEVVQAVDGSSALETANAIRPDVILLDIGLPDRSGLSVLAHLRDDHPFVPVVVVSVSEDARHVEEALNLGAVNFIRKPVKPHEFRFVLDRIFRSLERESDLHTVLKLVAVRQTSLSFPGRPAVLPKIVAYLGRELRNHYPGFRVPLPDIKLALYESLANAVEHGNLEIDYAAKSAAMQDRGAFEKLVEERLADPRYGGRKVHVTVVYHPESVEYRIRDEGPGFDPSPYGEHQDLTDTSALHGRGLALIAHYMNDVEWNEAGNEIRMTRQLHPEKREDETPTAG
jgi:CheY-like chemotaxis protein